MEQSRIHTLKKFTKEESSGTSVELGAEKDGSSGPSITAVVGTASSSSNSLLMKMLIKTGKGN